MRGGKHQLGGIAVQKSRITFQLYATGVIVRGLRADCLQ